MLGEASFGAFALGLRTSRGIFSGMHSGMRSRLPVAGKQISLKTDIREVDWWPFVCADGGIALVVR